MVIKKTAKAIVVCMLLACFGCEQTISSDPTKIREIPQYTAKKVGYIDTFGYVYEVEIEGNVYFVTTGAFCICPKLPPMSEKAP